MDPGDGYENYHAFLAEMIGTFFIAETILKTGDISEAGLSVCLPNCFALLLATLTIAPVSQGPQNPALTVMYMLCDAINNDDLSRMNLVWLYGLG
jgi:glycerol uptake facilitator-like aquaporin